MKDYIVAFSVTMVISILIGYAAWIPYSALSWMIAFPAFLLLAWMSLTISKHHL